MIHYYIFATQLYQLSGLLMLVAAFLVKNKEQKVQPKHIAFIMFMLIWPAVVTWLTFYTRNH